MSFHSPQGWRMLFYVSMRVLLFTILISFSIISAKTQWTLRISPSLCSFKDLNYSTSSHDREQHIVYALARGYVFAFNLKNFSIDSIPLYGESMYLLYVYSVWEYSMHSHKFPNWMKFPRQCLIKQSFVMVAKALS